MIKFAKGIEGQDGTTSAVCAIEFAIRCATGLPDLSEESYRSTGKRTASLNEELSVSSFWIV